MKKTKLIKTGVITLLASIMLFGFNLAYATTTHVPKIDDLIFKYKPQGSTSPVEDFATTDYIYSLPETASPLTLIGKISYFMLIIANILAFVSFVGSGLFMVMSMGEAEMLKKAKGIFTYTILAMIICATALAVVTGITNIQFFNP